MACRGIDLEASPVDEEVEEVDRSAMCEMEAAEALAGMARRRNLCDGGLGSSELQGPVTEASCSFQDCVKVAEQFHDYASTTITIPDKIEKIVEKVPSQLCSTSTHLNSIGKSRPKLTEAQKEERKLRRILANRESARETIRRRKAMHLELTKRAVDVLEENETLKKEKELVVEEYDSLKNRNKFLKAMLAKAKKTKQVGVQGEQPTSSSEHPCSAAMNPAVFLHSRPPMVPCFWPSILPSTKGFQFQYAAGSNPMSSSHFPILCSLQGQENPAAIDQRGAPGPGPAPLYVVAVPCLLPLVGQSVTPNFNPGANEALNAHPLHVDNNQLPSPSNRDMNAEAYNSGRAGHDGAPGKFTSGRTVESLRPSRNTNPNASSPPDGTFRHNLLHKNQEPVANTPKKAEDAYAATVARRRRKELMRLKSIHCEYNHLHHLASG